MRIVAWGPEHDRQTNWDAFNAAVAGMELHGLTVRLRRVGEHDYEPADLIVINGWRKEGRKHTEIIDQHLARGGRILVIDRGYLDRKKYWSLGWDGLNGRADFRNRGMPDDRWKRLRIELARWRESGSHIVVMGQVESDSSVYGVDVHEWVTKTCAELRLHSDRPIIYRPHPKASEPGSVPGIQTHDGHITEAMRDAWAVVTYNSNSGVDSAIAGIPVFAADKGSMAWALANRDLKDIERPKMPKRQQWAHDLAYAQWTLTEMRNGTAWDHLKSGLR